MACILIKKQSDMPAGVCPMKNLQEFLEILTPLMLTNHKPQFSSFYIHSAKDHSSSISSLQENPSGSTFERPGRAKGRKQQKIGFIFHQKHTAYGQPFDFFA